MTETQGRPEVAATADQWERPETYADLVRLARLAGRPQGGERWRSRAELAAMIGRDIDAAGLDSDEYALEAMAATISVSDADGGVTALVARVDWPAWWWRWLIA